MAEVSLRKVIKRYGQMEVVHGIDLEIAHNEFVVLVGPSGCGKSTTLRMIAGLEEISDGEIAIGGKVVNRLPPRQRNISMVFQNYALYPHMTVRENLGFSLKIAGKAREEIDRAADEAAQILGLTPYMDRTPGELSGGQRQRVAMGRAIVRHPDVFLFDEPLSNLDAKLRSQMRIEIKKLHQTVATTVVYVTHDQVEAMTLADRIVIMRDGHIVQTGTPLDVFERPVNTFVATFIGSPAMNLVDGMAEGGAIRLSDNVRVPLPHGFAALAEGQRVTFGFRADNLMPLGHGLAETGEVATLELPVSLAEPLGAETLLLAEIAGKEVQAKMMHPRPVSPGEVLKFQLALDYCHLFDAESGVRLERKRDHGTD
ncbi:carbohydrate ABC transporter ATP-binding protein (CUT1 family) [Rhodovulum imhoffii]|uniref:Carbohydrate ABC transporter ATP-binding protein (CUT1 family) n=1 Tax=Rhodovulum imhoffii TaxID=365340 RepID=A0A2T5BSD2_9RHOB|nr:sn-glycerol-3-phosphate ABC transporter ATP-binding protein UgpC [Rhodovulum imhoffii]MBK5933507.1 sugar ABC transporter ATP-binding protein [Rhodovulum imhoffii]PTN02257.1 carbohydrate ABC transporter ATP-binding protein (CUT1 family) [Rhodovulum imhoffii]